jgi:acyl dehydratase
LTAQAEVVDIRTDDDGAGVVELRITTTNQDGVEVFTGEATAAID